jgi:hypothetical protein
MTTPTMQEQIWNRACGNGAPVPGAGDVALAAMLTFHGMVQNVGTLDAIKTLSAEELAAARSGYRYFGFGNVAGIIGAGQAAIVQDLDIAVLEATLDDAYAAIVEDGGLMAAFAAHYGRAPAAYAPLQDA